MAREILIAKSGRSYVTVDERRNGTCRVECINIFPHREKVDQAFVTPNLVMAKREAREWLVGDGYMDWQRIDAAALDAARELYFDAVNAEG